MQSGAIGMLGILVPIYDLQAMALIRWWVKSLGYFASDGIAFFAHYFFCPKEVFGLLCKRVSL